MHAGKIVRSCGVLNAHKTEMDIVKEEKYVGDIITSDGKHTKNILARRSKGVGIVSEIGNHTRGSLSWFTSLCSSIDAKTNNVAVSSYFQF